MIVGISGKRGAGKDALADVFVEKHRFVRIGFADPMKRFLADAFEFSELQLYGPSAMREAVDPRFGKSPREMLQTLGTEWGRQMVHPDVWVRSAILRARRTLALSNVRGVVISDVRFPNELHGLRDAGAKVIRIKRASRGSSLHDEHESERALDDVPDSAFDAVIENNGTHAELAELANQFLSIRSR